VILHTKYDKWRLKRHRVVDVALEMQAVERERLAGHGGCIALGLDNVPGAAQGLLQGAQFEIDEASCLGRMGSTAGSALT
jgi:hypothetical protein